MLVYDKWRCSLMFYPCELEIIDIIFMLQVRLLTGISRYTEMSYIFQILKDNDQFEYLLGKGLDKVRVALK